MDSASTTRRGGGGSDGGRLFSDDVRVARSAVKRRLVAIHDTTEVQVCDTPKRGLLLKYYSF